MAAFDSNDPVPPAGPNPLLPHNRLAERLRHAFDHHTEVSRKVFLPEPVRRIIRFREQEEAWNGTWAVDRKSDWTSGWFIARPPLTEEDIRLHAWLNERLAVLHYERHGLWPKLRRFFLGNRLLRWLGLRSQRAQGR